MAAGWRAIDRRGVVRDVGIRAIRVERQMAVSASKRCAHGTCAMCGIANSGYRQIIAIEVRVI